MVILLKLSEVRINWEISDESQEKRIVSEKLLFIVVVEVGLNFLKKKPLEATDGCVHIIVG